MKKLNTLMLTSVALLALTACNNQSSGTKTAKEKPVVTVTTSFLDDMVNELAGDLVERQLIIPAGEDPHLYTAKSSDLKKLQEADLVLYHGLHFEGKMIEALEEKGSAVTRNFTKGEIGTMEEDGEDVVDPHFWFDVDLYQKAVEAASDDLQELLPNKKEVIEKNEKAYLTELDELDKWNKEQLSLVPEKSRYLVTPHDAFNYFANRYGFTLYAPQGVSTESEVANSDMIKTVDLIIDHNIKAIFTESTTNPERMKKLQEAVKAKGGSVEVVTGEHKELFSDSLAPAGEKGDTYVDMYKHNIKLIVDYLK
ncbi:metal ABC transporter solute-binding protein, Zn/Mn family [Streptococcus hillyeri]|uniref:Metal transporter n=1 Tax=Streptococcus hillyeri TaxID=2282420 RepID=A0A3L9DWS9_9STRE|nr:zinc ABC transporter substrate-binding protein [Streptococcus hillyeri]RLY04357.1 metal transporter [Streptococcus hillyeri]